MKSSQIPFVTFLFFCASCGDVLQPKPDDSASTSSLPHGTASNLLDWSPWVADAGTTIGVFDDAGDAEGVESQTDIDASSDTDDEDDDGGHDEPLCTEGQRRCGGTGDVEECAQDGQGFIVVEECSDTEPCFQGVCESLCDLAVSSHNNLGCAFFAVSTPNATLFGATAEQGEGYGFFNDFGVVVANHEGHPAAFVEVYRGGELVEDQIVEGGDVGLFTLEMDANLVDAYTSQIVDAAAYHIVSDVPVAAYQFNPLHFEHEDAQPEEDLNSIFNLDDYSYSNDASLLLPVQSMGTRHRVTSWYGMSSLSFVSSPFITVVASEDDTVVELTPSVDTVGGDLAAINAGETESVTLDAGDVIQLLGCQQNCACYQEGTCDYLKVAELTGSLVVSDKPVEVFAGSECTMIPTGVPACDHLEETMLPTTLWGNSYGIPAFFDAALQANRHSEITVVADDDVTVSFDPPIAPPVSLAAGEFFRVATDDNVHISADGPIGVAAALYGGEHHQSAEPSSDEQLSVAGDPAMTIFAPVGLARKDYEVLTPSTYLVHFLSLVGKLDSEVVVDGETVTLSMPVGDSEYGSARVEVTDGVHHLASNMKFNVVTYGYAPWTSYAYPGGLALKY